MQRGIWIRLWPFSPKTGLSLRRKQRDAAPLEEWDCFAGTAESVSDCHTLVRPFARLPQTYRAALEMELPGYAQA